MRHVTFVTGNEIKFRRAKHLADQLGFTLDQANIDFEEMQTDSKTIAERKALEAYGALQKPVVITDDEWIIPGLNGFPGAYMKYMNEWLTPQDWLNLTRNLQDRSIILRRHAIYKDAEHEQYFVDNEIGVLLSQIQGESKYPHLTITSFDGGTLSRAQELAQPDLVGAGSNHSAWHQLAAWFKTLD